MGNNVSVEERVYKTARNGEHSELASIINQILRQGQQAKRYLEFQDAAGQTPLIIAAYRGYFSCVDLLVKHGANVSHVTRAPECNTALHEAVSRGHLQIAELLMRAGANPFLENGRGLTSVDVAINRQHTPLLRSLELRSDFTATLQMKVPRFMGLGAEWKDRWCVVMPRYQLTTGRATIARSLFVCYKDNLSCTPSCKVWLDGSIARQVVGSAGASVLQCALSLHKNHALAANVHMTGDSSMGYTMHLRPKDASALSIQALTRFMDLVNGSRQTAAQSRVRPGSRPGSTPQTPASPSRPPPQAVSSAQQLKADEDLARRLQATYNQEWSDHKCPPVNLHDRVSQPYSSSTAPGQPPIMHGYPDSTQAAPAGGQQSRHNHQHSADSTASFHSVPSAPLYPEINLTSGARPSQPPPGGQPTEAFGASLDWYKANAAQASVPPPSASVATADAQGPSTSAQPPAAVDEDDDAGQCVICLAAPSTAGFLHGESVHKCCCRDCAKELKKSNVPLCPMCRQPIEHVILNFY